MKIFFDSIVFSYAQIFFSNRRWFGIAILLSTLLVPKIGLTALFCVALTNVLAQTLSFDENKIRNGFYGYNGILFGAFVGYYFNLDINLFLLIIIFVVICFLITAALENYFAVAFNLPGLSLPFVFTTASFLIFLSNYNYLNLTIFSPVDLNGSFILSIVKNYFYTFSYTMFSPNIFAGIIISVAVLFFSRTLFVLSLMAYLLNYFFLKLILPNSFDSLLIISGVNSILTAFALGGSLIIPARKNLILVVFSIIFIIIFSGISLKIFQNTQIPILTIPFNIIVISTLYGLKFRQDTINLVLLYFTPGSPEENYYYHTNRKKRLSNVKNIFLELPFYGKWFVSQGFDGKYTHKEKWKYAWDFVVKGENGIEFENYGENVDDYYCYSLPVLAPADGTVEKTFNYAAENPIKKIDEKNNWGNTVVINHGYGLFSSLSHLKQNSITVKEGDYIKQGEKIAECGNSGRSPTPHLHFQLQTNNKIGSDTFKFPFSSFIENGELKSFDYVAEGSTVQNFDIESEENIFGDLNVGEKIKLEATENGNIFTEEWMVKIDLYNNYYFENNKKDVAYFLKTKKMFYFTNYIGKKNTALYYFYFSTLQSPMFFVSNLEWSGECSTAEAPNSLTKYASELFLIFKSYIKSTAKFSFIETKSGTNELRAEVNFNGTGLFKFYKRNYNSTIKLNEGGRISELNFYKENKNIFTAKIIERN